MLFLLVMVDELDCKVGESSCMSWTFASATTVYTSPTSHHSQVGMILYAHHGATDWYLGGQHCRYVHLHAGRGMLLDFVAGAHR